MPDEDIERLALDVKSLTPEAKEALRIEMDRRQLQTSSIDWAARPAPQRSDWKETGRRARDVRVVLIVLTALFVLISFNHPSLVGCKTNDELAQQYRNVDIDSRNTYTVFNQQFGRGRLSSCQSGVITTDCAAVNWPLVSARFRADYSALGGWSIQDSAEPEQLIINKSFLGTVCGEKFDVAVQKQEICGRKAPFDGVQMIWSINSPGAYGSEQQEPESR
jgi:hypothetical protein